MSKRNFKIQCENMIYDFKCVLAVDKNKMNVEYGYRLFDVEIHFRF